MKLENIMTFVAVLGLANAVIIDFAKIIARGIKDVDEVAKRGGSFDNNYDISYPFKEVEVFWTTCYAPSKSVLTTNICDNHNNCRPTVCTTGITQVTTSTNGHTMTYKTWCPLTTSFQIAKCTNGRGQTSYSTIPCTTSPEKIKPTTTPCATTNKGNGGQPGKGQKPTTVCTTTSKGRGGQPGDGGKPTTPCTTTATMSTTSSTSTQTAVVNKRDVPETAFLNKRN